MDNRKTILRNCSVACEVRVNLNHSTEVHSHLSIGSKAARDKVNQIAHVRKSRGSLGTTNMAAERERASAFGSKDGLFTALIQIFQRI